jgi:hypothetical protein
MSTIQEIINTHTSEMVVQTELEMNNLLLEIKEKLIRDLAEKYDFDVEDALKHFAEEVPMVKKEKKEKKVKKVKKVKDPNAPKKVTTAYFFYLKEKRSEVADELKGLSSKEIVKKISVMWNLIKDTDDANPYHALNAADKTRFASEMLLYSTPSSPTSD